ncbi:MAG: Single-stranded-DNA-specific exonuclease RecJ [Microgenomates group bacterium GW2011_GWA2_44_7]|nr:MAG: Single-stranded-DNA-specific exonuclease RecJ [Microgenomates group bacterium GW2011_GWA2_44_7]KKT78195.1 MAG: Single-stranded-DNA-specific exonuclease RecJ [Microgenomates group bacterium GW2011_GWB1_44_8]
MKTYQIELTSKEKPKNAKEIIHILLANRGLKTEDEVQIFFSPRDPLDYKVEEVGIEANEFERALRRIKKAISQKEKMIVYGDYDADGVCATAILWETIYSLGGNVLPYIPNRLAEGYGLNEESIAKLKREDPQLKLIITVDHGIVGHQKIDFAQELGVEVIVSDHHQPGGTIPKALAVIHTTLLSGSGVAWMLARELASDNNFSKKLLELVALGTIADLIPLTGVNRSLTKEGIEQIKQTERVGLKCLMEVARIDQSKVGTYEVGYMLTPRLNAMGRMEQAISSLRLLCTRDENKARELALELDRTNRERQLLTEETTLHARQLLLTKLTEKRKAIIFLAHESYQQGVIGLVAGRLAEEYYQPTIVISRGERYSKASARSIQGFNIIETIREAENMLVDVGGHPMAAGFTVETAKLGLLEEKLQELALSKLGLTIASRTLRVDVEVELSQIDTELVSQIEKFRPFGQGNSEPLFASFGLKVVDTRVVGVDGKHLKLVLSDKNSTQRLDAIGFGMGEYYKELSPGCLVDVAYNVTRETWNGTEKLQLRLRDLKLCSQKS